MKFLLGVKKEMTQIFTEDHKAIPVTKIKAGPCFVSAIKTAAKDGYVAVQLVFVEKKKGKKPVKGHLNGIGTGFFQYVKEFRVLEKDVILEKIKKGQEITVDIFNKGEKVKLTGISKGKGFQGVVKRHGFSGGPASHGHKDQLRMPGSIGATGPAHVFKGTKLPGQMGNKQATVHNLEIIDIDPENNLLFVKGAVPGAMNGLVLICNFENFEVKKKVKEVKEVKKEKEEKKEKKEKKAS